MAACGQADGAPHRIMATGEAGTMASYFICRYATSLCYVSLDEIERCMEIGLLCTQIERGDRPTMPDVFEMLNQ